jgi:C1A family cysteine protease
MQVENTFRSYESGIFEEPPAKNYVGGHAVKCLGWGEDAERAAQPEKYSYIQSHYWICANSWSE